MNHVVRVHWLTSSGNAAAGLAYLAHREEPVTGRSAELYGLGKRYEALGHDEHTLAQLLQRDGNQLPEPRYYRLKLTLHDAAAKRLSTLRADARQRALRAAVRDALRQALPRAQGVYVLHSHGGHGRPWGHPHSHVNLSPREEIGGQTRLRRDDLERLRQAWAQALQRAIERECSRDVQQNRKPTTTISARLPHLKPNRRAQALQPAGAIAGAFLARLRRMTEDEEEQRARA